MAYVSDSNLAQFWGLAKDYIKAENSRYANWQKTEKAGAVTCYPVGETPHLPTVDFLFSETGPASGDKGPENPSTITGVESVKVTRCGKNLLAPSYNSSTAPSGSSATSGGITVQNSYGEYVVTGTNTSGDTLFFHIVTAGGNELVLPSGNYVFSAGIPSSITANIRVQIVAYQNGDAVVNTYSKDSSVSFTIPDGPPATMRVYFRIGSEAVIPSGCVAYPQLELGSTATAFEKYEGTSYVIQLGSTCYGGSIDLATGVMTVTHWADTITSANGLNRENTNTVGVSARLSKVGEIDNNANNLICDAFPFAGDQSDSEHIRFQAGGDAIVIYIAKSRLEYVDNWVDPATAWLTQNPITVVYKLATPYTVQLAPTQILSLAQTDKYTPRLNTVYTDASAVQVGYAKSPVRSEYELTQAIIATEGGE